MKLSDLESAQLLPRFAEAYEFACEALDQWMSMTRSRADALSSPWTLEGIAALTEDELRDAYKIYSTADYYPDLPRSARDQFLFEQIVNIRKLGTIEAVKALMRYIYPGMSVTIDDTIAFDANGNVIDSSLLHCYDLHLNLDLSQLPEYVMGRVMDNVRRFMRATAALHSISYQAGVDIPIHPVAINGEQAVMSTVLETCAGDADAWGIYGYYPIGLDDGNEGTSNKMAVTINNSGAVPWTLTQIRNWTNSVYSGSTAATASKLMRTSSVLYKKEEAKRIVGIFYNTTLTSSVTTKLRDGQFGIYKNSPTITVIEPLYRADFI